MIFERFNQGASLLHRTDTRIKIVSAVLLTMVISLCNNFYTGVAGLLPGLLLLFLARLKFSQVAWRLLAVNSFIAFLWVMLPLTYPGDVLWTIGPVGLSRQGIALAAFITVKANAVVLLFITLLATADAAELGYGLESLRVPNKLCLLLLFSYRYISVVSQEYQRLVRAAKVRCFSPGTNLHTYRTYAYLFGMTLVKSWSRAERVGQAMQLRGFNGRFYRLDKPRLAKRDIVFLFTVLLIAVSLEVLECTT